MKLGIVITMYDEHRLVLQSMKNIRSVYSDSTFVVIQSNDGLGETEELKEIKMLATYYELKEDLSKKYSEHEYPARSICRNLSTGYTAIYETGKSFDIITSFTGDTLITDATFLERLQSKMNSRGWIAMVSQPIANQMHEEYEDGTLDAWARRVNEVGDTDTTCSLIVLNGTFALVSKVFSNIQLINRYCSEQCLGKELDNCNSKDFHQVVGRLNDYFLNNPYSFNDGVVYHAEQGGPAGRNQ